MIALTAAPVAFATSNGAALRGGVKNPSGLGGFSSETDIWAFNNSWGTRQSNLGKGGAAIYGCRAPAGGSPCLDADNLKGGRAFSLITTGATGGTITVGSSTGTPFTTNAHGVATGLNSNYLEGHQASDFAVAAGATGATGVTGVTGAAANAVDLGGVPAAQYAQRSQLLYADVHNPGTTAPTITAERGASAVSGPAGGVFKVVFTADVHACAFSATPVGAALTSGSLGVAPDVTNSDTVDVATPAGFGGTDFDLQIVC